MEVSTNLRKKALGDFLYWEYKTGDNILKIGVHPDYFLIEKDNVEIIKFDGTNLYLAGNIINDTLSIGDDQYYIFGTGITKYRIGIRDNQFVTDKSLTELGFDGVENTDWENLSAAE